MKTLYIHLKSGALVKDFVETVKHLNGRIELVADRTVLDAKSILGIYAMDLSKPLLLRIEDDTADFDKLKPYWISNYGDPSSL